MQALAERPPYVRFEKRSREVRGGPETTGMPSYVDENWVIVVSPGSKDEFESVADDWFSRKAGDVKAGRFRADWLHAFQQAYTMWKNDEEPPVMGTHISLWPGITPSQFKTLRDLRVLTIEDVAAMNEDTLSRVGMGSRSLKDRATAFLESAKNAVPAEKLVALAAERDELKTQLLRLEAQVKGLTNQIAASGLGAKL